MLPSPILGFKKNGTIFIVVYRNRGEQWIRLIYVRRVGQNKQERKMLVKIKCCCSKAGDSTKLPRKCAQRNLNGVSGGQPTHTQSVSIDATSAQLIRRCATSLKSVPIAINVFNRKRQTPKHRFPPDRNCCVSRRRQMRSFLYCRAGRVSVASSSRWPVNGIGKLHA